MAHSGVGHSPSSSDSESSSRSESDGDSVADGQPGNQDTISGKTEVNICLLQGFLTLQFKSVQNIQYFLVQISSSKSYFQTYLLSNMRLRLHLTVARHSGM